VLELDATRIVATPRALDTATWTAGLVLRTAPDEVLLVSGAPPEIADSHAIVQSDAGWMGMWMATADFEIRFGAAADWALPTDRPAFAQGMMHHLPVKLWVEHERVLLVVPRSLAHELAERMHP
jgi:hypothetical protein